MQTPHYRVGRNKAVVLELLHSDSWEKRLDKEGDILIQLKLAKLGL